MSPDVHPFSPVAQVLRDMRDAYVRELAEVERTDWSNRILGLFATIVTNCEHADRAIADLGRRDQPGFDAFLRAMERLGGPVPVIDGEAE